MRRLAFHDAYSSRTALLLIPCVRTCRNGFSGKTPSTRWVLKCRAGACRVVRRRAPGMLPLKSQPSSRRLRSSSSSLKVLGSDPFAWTFWLASRKRSVRDADCGAPMLWSLERPAQVRRHRHCRCAALISNAHALPTVESVHRTACSPVHGCVARTAKKDGQQRRRAFSG